MFMKEYLVERTCNEFGELNTIYKELFAKWKQVWDSPEIHNSLYSCYVRLKIVSILLRSCLEYGFVENVTLKTKECNESLKDFCDYVIHHSACMYEDNGSIQDDLEIYLLIKTDLKDEVAFVINKNMRTISQAIDRMLETRRS
jgi:hypothetical protein